MGTNTMKVDSTRITLDTKEDPYKDYRTSIVENLVSYTSFEDEKEKESKEKERKKSKK